MNVERNAYPAQAAETPARAPTARPIASGKGWSISEYVCALGPSDRPFEESHADAAISAVVAGSFRYRTASASALLHPGAFLLGNAGACFECGHDHDGGDRCIAFHYEPALFEEIAATAAGSYRYRFAVAMLPARRELAALCVDVETIAAHTDPMAVDELAIRLATRVLGAASGVSEKPARVSAREQRRIGDAVRYIEEHAHQPLELRQLADTVFMSKYHFLRTFRKVVGITPHRYVLGAKLRSAAFKLRTTAEPIASVALAAGFGDLSTFNGHFRDAFGTNPGAFRLERRRMPAG